MKIAILKSVGSSGEYPIPVALIRNFLAPFFQEKGWMVTDFAVVDGSASFIMVTGEGQAGDVEGVLQDFLKHVNEVTHAPDTREKLNGVEYPGLYLCNISILAVLGSSDQDADIFADYVVDGLCSNARKEITNLEEEVREIGDKFRNF